MSETYPEESPKTIINWASQVWTFAKLINVGDLVALPLKQAPAIAFGRVTNSYDYDLVAAGSEHHFVRVQWLTKQLPRAKIDKDLLYSFGAVMTVCRIARNDAESRIRALLSIEPATVPLTQKTQLKPTLVETMAPSDESAPVNLEELARDTIRQHITRKFDGHDLAELVEAVLIAQGFKTYRSPAGPDGGIDVLAGQGPHGFDGARLAVQAKPGNIEVDTSIFREFRGVMSSFGAQQGLIVSWGGFRTSVLKERPAHFFNIRMWDADDLIAEIVRHYETLSPNIQARLPLKQVWMLVTNEDAN